VGPHCSFCGTSTRPFSEVEGLFTVLMCTRCRAVRHASPPALLAHREAGEPWLQWGCPIPGCGHWVIIPHELEGYAAAEHPGWVARYELLRPTRTSWSGSCTGGSRIRLRPDPLLHLSQTEHGACAAARRSPPSWPTTGPRPWPASPGTGSTSECTATPGKEGSLGSQHGRRFARQSARGPMGCPGGRWEGAPRPSTFEGTPTAGPALPPHESATTPGAPLPRGRSRRTGLGALCQPGLRADGVPPKVLGGPHPNHRPGKERQRPCCRYRQATSALSKPAAGARSPHRWASWWRPGGRPGCA
jgi:hypothetical protein